MEVTFSQSRANNKLRPAGKHERGTPPGYRAKGRARPPSSSSRRWSPARHERRERRRRLRQSVVHHVRLRLLLERHVLSAGTSVPAPPAPVLGCHRAGCTASAEPGLPHKNSEQISAEHPRIVSQFPLCPVTSSMSASANLSALTAISPVDGRYGDKSAPLREHFSEYGLIKQRVLVEVRWLLALADAGIVPQLPPFDATSRALIESLADNFTVAEAEKVKQIERTTNHDVKAVEYYLKQEAASRLQQQGAGGGALAERLEFFHFACTSEDINNLAYARMLLLSREEVLVPIMEKVEATVVRMAHDLAEVPMLAHTHGQPATPTTVGKELANVAIRLRTQLKAVRTSPILGKIAGATGSYQAHVVACPNADWPTFAKGFVESLGLSHNAHTTQARRTRGRDASAAPMLASRRQRAPRPVPSAHQHATARAPARAYADARAVRRSRPSRARLQHSDARHGPRHPTPPHHPPRQPPPRTMAIPLWTPWIATNAPRGRLSRTTLWLSCSTRSRASIPSSSTSAAICGGACVCATRARVCDTRVRAVYVHATPGGGAAAARPAVRQASALAALQRHARVAPCVSCDGGMALARRYISLGYFKQRVVAGEVGSSTMPHKVNPIDFENAEGNLGLANAMLSHLAAKLYAAAVARGGQRVAGSAWWAVRGGQGVAGSAWRAACNGQRVAGSA